MAKNLKRGSQNRLWPAIGLALLATLLTFPAADTETSVPASRFTGKVLPVFYVTDVIRSVQFYRDGLGFEFHHFFDYETGRQVAAWTKEEPPIWAEMAAGELTFGLHLKTGKEPLVVGGTRHYFMVEDVEAHHAMVKAAGVEAGELVDKPWMKMFRVLDPDGHEIFIGTEK